MSAQVHIITRKTPPKRATPQNPAQFRCITEYVDQGPCECAAAEGMRLDSWAALTLALLGKLPESMS